MATLWRWKRASKIHQLPIKTKPAVPLVLRKWLAFCSGFRIIIPSMRTPQYKQEILQHFADCHLLSIKELEAKVPDADYSTLFRNITALVESGDLKRVVVDKNRVLYERADHAHDHLVCDDCGKVEAIDLPRPAIQTLTIESVLARGACEDCSKARP